MVVGLVVLLVLVGFVGQFEIVGQESQVNIQVWSITQFHSVDYSLSRISVNK